jgi:hypothetical protein
VLAIFYIVITHLSGHTTPGCAVAGQVISVGVLNRAVTRRLGLSYVPYQLAGL